MGNPFEAISPGIVFKQYPSCGSTHPAIDALLSLRKEHKLRPEDVERVECAMDYRRRSVLLYDRPETGLQGKFSMQFCLAVALLEGQMGLRQVTDEKVRDPAVRSWMERIEVYVHPEQKTQESLKNRFIDVKVVTRDGRELAKRVYKAKGNPEVPLSAEELTAKFRDCASIALPVDQVESCLKLLSRLEELEDTRWLMNTCRQEI